MKVMEEEVRIGEVKGGDGKMLAGGGVMKRGKARNKVRD